MLLFCIEINHKDKYRLPIRNTRLNRFANERLTLQHAGPTSYANMARPQSMVNNWSHSVNPWGAHGIKKQLS